MDVTFASLGLMEPLLRAIQEQGYTEPTPIQSQTIPQLLTGRDLLGIARTGTGKTAAFALPMLQRLSANRRAPIAGSTRAVVLTPTRELALQVKESFDAYGRHLRLSHAVIFGGVGQGSQVAALARGVDVLVATPGRLMDLMGQGHLRLARVEIFVLDEADRMLDMGFIADIRRIVATLPKARQTLLFSATMPDDIAGLAQSILTDPIRVAVDRVASPVEQVDQRVIFVEAARKRDLLARVLRDPAIRRALVFTRTKHGADRVAQHLERTDLRVGVIHSDKSQPQRQRSLEAFRAGSLRVLVATDIAARGIDVDDITHVINFDVPNEPESYIHRIGRTARAGATGSALSFCSPDERPYLRDIEKLIQRKITAVEVPSGGNGDEPARPAARGKPDRSPSASRSGVAHAPASRQRKGAAQSSARGRPAPRAARPQPGNGGNSAPRPMAAAAKAQVAPAMSQAGAPDKTKVRWSAAGWL